MFFLFFLPILFSFFLSLSCFFFLSSIFFKTYELYITIFNFWSVLRGC